MEFGWNFAQLSQDRKGLHFHLCQSFESFLWEHFPAKDFHDGRITNSIRIRQFCWLLFPFQETALSILHKSNDFWQIREWLLFCPVFHVKSLLFAHCSRTRQCLISSQSYLRHTFLNLTCYE